MNARDEAIALRDHLLERGFQVSKRAIGRILRELGLKFTEAELRGWLDAPPTQKTSTNDAVPTHSSRAYANKDLVYIASSLRSDTSDAIASQAELASQTQSLDTLPGILANGARASRGTRVPRQPQLALADAAKYAARREILDAAWARIQPHVNRALTKTEWVKRNSRTAMSLAEIGRTPAECIGAWESASRRLGAPVRSLSIVQDELCRTQPVERASGGQATEDEMVEAIQQGFA